MKKSWFFYLMNFWPPFFGAGIRVTSVSSDLRAIDVEMKLRFWNQNYVGTHYGGSLFSMTDPFLMLMLIENLGRDYIVWDKSASIRFKKPGKGKVSVQFRLSSHQIESIRSQASEQPKVEPVFHLSVHDESGAVVATVEKTLSVKKKDHRSHGKLS